MPAGGTAFGSILVGLELNRPVGQNYSSPMASIGRSRAAGAAVFAVSLAVYLFTLAPDLTWGDSGELVTAVHTLGIPHPTGYPLYILAGRVFSLLPIGSTAYRMNLFSGICAALAALVIFRASILFLRGRAESNQPGEQAPDSCVLAAATAAALSLAFTPLFWFQATKAEVYAPASLLGSLLLLAALKSRASAAVGPLSGWALCLGLAVAHHRLLLLLVPVTVWLAAPSIRRHVAPGLMIRMAVMFLVGASPILYLWLRGRAGPALNWGGIDSLREVAWCWSGGDYGETLANPLGALRNPDVSVPGRLIGFFRPWFGFAFSQFGWATLLGLLGLGYWLRRSLGFGLLFTATLFLAVVLPACYLVADKPDFFYLFPLLLAPAIAEGIRWAARAVTELVRGIGRGTMSAVFLVMPLWMLFTGWSEGDRSGDTGAAEYGRRVLETAGDGLMIVTGVDANELSRDNEIHTLWYEKYVRRGGDGPILFGANFVAYAWYEGFIRDEGLALPRWEQHVLEGRALRQGEGKVVFTSRDHWVRAIADEVLLPALSRGKVYSTGTSPGPWQGIVFEEVDRVAVDPLRAHAFERPFLPSGRIYRLSAPESGAGRGE